MPFGAALKWHGHPARGALLHGRYAYATCAPIRPPVFQQAVRGERSELTGSERINLLKIQTDKESFDPACPRFLPVAQ